MMFEALMVLLAIVLFLNGLAVEHEWDGTNVILTVLILVILWSALPITGETVVAALEGWPKVVFSVVGYLVLGAAWSTFKWFLRVNSDVSQAEIRENLKKGYGTPLSIDVAYNKARLIRWIVWWPGSIVWNLTYKFVVRAGRFVYDLLASMFKGIADAAVRKASRD